MIESKIKATPKLPSIGSALRKFFFCGIKCSNSPDISHLKSQPTKGEPKTRARAIKPSVSPKFDSMIT